MTTIPQKFRDNELRWSLYRRFIANPYKAKATILDCPAEWFVEDETHEAIDRLELMATEELTGHVRSHERRVELDAALMALDCIRQERVELGRDW